MAGTLHGKRVCFLSRHGSSHQILPTELPSKANIWALKSMGASAIISVSAVGSLRKKIKPLHLVIPDQLIDRTRGRQSTTPCWSPWPPPPRMPWAVTGSRTLTFGPTTFSSRATGGLS
ncbi:hypothetical protein [uncultured Arthrobacter sp.]|uniref:phosphorylase family protein n=1 Tax=uncultured Arthrobacter sp. TaxID=114050 RepID=UPI0032167844